MHIQTHFTFAYTHPTSHTNPLNHYHFIFKQNKTKDKTHLHYKISNHSNKSFDKEKYQTKPKKRVMIHYILMIKT